MQPNPLDRNPLDKDPTETGGRLALFKVLGENTRYAIYLELARSVRPLTTADIAATIGLHPNTVRPHLERMREAGLVEVAIEARGEIGRPQHRYSLVDDAPSLGLEPPVMPMLARLVLDLADQLGATGDDAARVGAGEGRRRSKPLRFVPSSLEALVLDLDQLGFDPVVTDADDPDAAVVLFGHCPFGSLAEEHPDLVCELHRGLVTGFVDALEDTEVRRFCPLVDTTPCRVTLASRA